MPTYRMIGHWGLKRMQFREDGTQLPDEVIPRGELFEPWQSELEAFSDLMELVSDELFGG